jgi:tRNA (guanine37-N1)-methyltransferase
MGAPLKMDVVTIFPDMLNSVLGESILKRASAAGHIQVRSVNPRDFTHDVHRTTDDRPYGGGPGMVMKPEPLCAAVESVLEPGARVLLMSPTGRRFDQALARELAAEHQLVFICGHYEGIDDRVRQALVTDEVSIGDYVLTNGVLAAGVVIDAVTRLIPGVLGHGESAEEESFSRGLLEYPQYTRPPEFRGMKVPDILLSGDHGAVRAWREAEAMKRTRAQRPDLLAENGQQEEE